MELDELRQTAIHEAGHVVAAACLFTDRAALAVSIVPRGDEALGYSTLDLAVARDPERRAVVVASGYAALIVAGCSDGVARAGAVADFEYITHELHQPLNHVLVVAIELMSEPDNVTAVAKLADALLRHRTIDGVDIGRVIAGLPTNQEEFEQENRYRAYLFSGSE